MNTSNRLNVLPGFIYKGKKPDAYSSATEFVKSLEDYVSKFQLPVAENSSVLSIEKLQPNPYYTVTVSQDNEGIRTYNCWQVIIASGSMNIPYIPAFSKQISPSITQLHSSDVSQSFPTSGRCCPDCRKCTVWLSTCRGTSRRRKKGFSFNKQSSPDPPSIQR